MSAASGGSRRQEEMLRLEYEKPLMITHHGDESQRPRRQPVSSPAPEASGSGSRQKQARDKDERSLLLTNSPSHAGDRSPRRLEEKDRRRILLSERSTDGSRQQEVLRLEYEAPLMIKGQGTNQSQTRRQQASSPTTKTTNERNSKVQEQCIEERPLLLTNAPAKEGDWPSRENSVDREEERRRALHQRSIQRKQKLLRDEAAVVSAYADFFNHISLRRGWKTVPFELEAIRPLLAEAAAIVVRVRCDLDEVDGGSFKIRQVDGSARDFMWTVKEDPSKCPRRGGTFIRQIVHATFRDRSGYVEGLTAQRVDKDIDDFFGLTHK